MTQPKFTPGPWMAMHQGTESANTYAILTAQGWDEGAPWIASVQGQNVGPVNEDETRANASLIVSAPDMYAALEALVLDCADYEPWQRPCLAFDNAKAVLAKAGRA
jgi:hypothetical protein